MPSVRLGGAQLLLVRRVQLTQLPPVPGVLNSGQYRSSAWGATVRGTYRTPKAGTRTQYVLLVGPWGQGALRLRYVPDAGGWYA